MLDKHSEIKTGFWIEADLRLVSGLDARMMVLLRAIEQTNSLNQAARAVGLSYKGAWQMLERANNVAPHALVTTATGGSKGGGSQLTPAGKRLLALYLNVQEQHRQFLQQLNQALLADPELCWFLKPLAVKTSVANQMFVRIEAITRGLVQAELQLVLKGGANLVASLDVFTLEQLKLAVGDEILAMIPAAEIVLLPIAELAAVSARNQLLGQVLRVDRDELVVEIVLGLTGGDSLFVMMSLTEFEAFHLQSGEACAVVFKANAVMLAVPEVG